MGGMCASFHWPLSWDLQGSLSQELGELAGLSWGHFQGTVMGAGGPAFPGGAGQWAGPRGSVPATSSLLCDLEQIA